MKKIALITIILAITISSSFACDICGGGVGSYYTGLLPQFNKKLIGIRYQYNQLYTQLDINGNKTPLSNKEQYQTIDMWGAWNIGSKWRVLAIVPYSFIEKQNIGTDLKTTKNGLSDISAYGYYNIFQNNNNNVNQSIWLGIGAKFATGKYNNLEVTSNSPNIFQLGTGSTDILTQVMYDLNVKSWGMNSTINYKINTKNTGEYQYGNKLTANLTVYHKFDVGFSSRIIPNLGIQYENQQKDKTMHYIVDQTGGNLLQGSIGIESSFNKIAIGINFQQPLSQNLASHRIDLQNKIMTHISYAF